MSLIIFFTLSCVLEATNDPTTRVFIAEVQLLLDL